MRYGFIAVAAIFLTSATGSGQRAGVETCKRHMENQGRAVARAQLELQALNRELGDGATLDALAQRVTEISETMSNEAANLAMVHGLEAFESDRRNAAIRQHFSGRDLTQRRRSAEDRYRLARQARVRSFLPSFPVVNRVAHWNATSEGVFAGIARFEQGALSVEIQIVSDDFVPSGIRAEGPAFVVQRLAVTIRRGTLAEVRSGIRILEVGSGQRLSMPPRPLGPSYPSRLVAHEINATEMLHSLRGGALSMIQQAGQWDHVHCRELLERANLPRFVPTEASVSQ